MTIVMRVPSLNQIKMTSGQYRFNLIQVLNYQLTSYKTCMYTSKCDM